MTILQILILAAPLQSELERYEATAIELHLQSGFRAEMRRHGVRIPYDFFGSEREIFAASPDAMRFAHDHRLLNIGGLAGIIGGVVLLAAGLAVATAPSGNWRAPAAYTLLSTSTAAITAGAGALIIAPLFLSRAVAAYNEDMFE